MKLEEFHRCSKADLETLSEMSSPRKSPEVCHRPRTRSSVTIWHLPPEVLTNVFERLHIRDFLSVQTVCREFHEIAIHPSVWKRISFFNLWPNTDRLLELFVKAGKHGNFEALIKLAFLNLYNDHLPQREKREALEEQAELAAMYFHKAEKLSPFTFTWAFLRPPWALNQPSCKVYVFQTLLELAANKKLKLVKESKSKIALCIGRTMHLREKEEEATSYIRQAAQLGLHEAQVLEWDLKYSHGVTDRFTDFAVELEAVRQLRSLVQQKPSDVLTQLMLCKCYVKGSLGGYEWSKAVTFTRQVFQSSCPVNVCTVMVQPNPPKCSKRYILVDWLVEVATNLNMSTQMLLNAVAMVDLCLLAHTFQKAEIQLLGVSALLITSRYMASDIMTIREAVWYTDNTYNYQNVVEMVAHIVSVVRGNIRQVTSHDFTSALESMWGLGEQGSYLLDYITELCLLQDYMTVYSPARKAAASVLMARILENCGEVWPSKLEEVTGFTVKDLTPCVFNINHCLMEDVVFDNLNTPLQAVKLRFTGEDSPYDLSYIKPLSVRDLQEKLGVASPKEQMATLRVNVHQAEKLICSPSRGKHRSRRMSIAERPSREDAATPPLDLDASGYDIDYDYDSDPFDLNESFRSEDAEEEPRIDSFLEMSSEPDGAHPPHFISDCSQVALSSPFGVKINMSNMSNKSYSTRSSVIASSSASTSVCQSVASSSSGYSEDTSQPPFSDSDDDSNSLGFSCSEEFSSLDENDMSESEDNTAASLPYPTAESSANREQNKGRLYDPVDVDFVQDYGILNEAFCEPDDAEEQASSCEPSPFLQDQNWDPADVANSCQKKTQDSESMKKKQVSEGGFVVEECQDREQDRNPCRPQTRGLLASCAVSGTNKSDSPCIGGCDENRSVKQDVYLLVCSDALLSISSLSWQQQAVESEATGMNWSPAVVVCPGEESSTASSSAAKKRVTPIIPDGKSLSSPVTVSSCSCQQLCASVLDADSATARRRSLRSSTRSQQLQEGSISHGHLEDRQCESAVVCGVEKRNIPVCQSPMVDNGDQKEGRCEDGPAVVKRKSPRLPAQIASPDSVPSKRQRRSSANYGNYCVQ